MGYYIDILKNWKSPAGFVNIPPVVRIRREIRRRGTLPEKQSVYIMKALGSGLYKIGISVHPNQRRTEIQYQVMDEITIIATKEYEYRQAAEMEKDLHITFARDNVYHEWFDLTDEDIAWAVASW